MSMAAGLQQIVFFPFWFSCEVALPLHKKATKNSPGATSDGSCSRSVRHPRLLPLLHGHHHSRGTLVVDVTCSFGPHVAHWRPFLHDGQVDGRIVVGRHDVEVKRVQACDRGCEDAGQGAVAATNVRHNLVELVDPIDCDAGHRIIGVSDGEPH